MMKEAQSEYEQRCLETLEMALSRTALYRPWRKFDPGPRESIDARYHCLPVLTKDDIRAYFPKGVVPAGLDLDAALSNGEVSFVRTSGTADEALENIWNQPWWNASERASWKLNAVAAATATGTHREAILASAQSVGPRSESGPIDRKDRMLGRFLFLNEFSVPGFWRSSPTTSPRSSRPTRPSWTAWPGLPGRQARLSISPRLLPSPMNSPPPCSSEPSAGCSVLRSPVLTARRRQAMCSWNVSTADSTKMLNFAGWTSRLSRVLQEAGQMWDGSSPPPSETNGSPS